MSNERTLIERFYKLTLKQSVSTKEVRQLKEDFQRTPVKDKNRLFLKTSLKVLAIFNKMIESGDRRINITLSKPSDRKEIKEYLSCGTEPKVNISKELKQLKSEKKKSIKKAAEKPKKPTTKKTKPKAPKVDKNRQTALFGLTPFSEWKNEAPVSTFKISGDIGKILGNIEIKPVHSIVATLDAPQGAGKTRFLLQVANELCKKYNVLFISLEEHPQSDVFNKKVKQYLTPATEKRFFAIGELENGFSTVQAHAANFDVVMIDSWGKATKNQNIDLDTDLRKKFNGKLFFPVYQRTQDGKMRGGSEAQFDGDIILKIQKQLDFKDNFVYADKNRYQNMGAGEIQYNVYHQRINKVE